MVRSRSIRFLLLLSLAGLSWARGEEAIRGFISVEPFEVRLEALVRADAYGEVWRMEADSLGPAERQAVLDNMLTLFESGVNLKPPDGLVAFSERSARFVVPDVERGYAADTRESIPLSEALVGLTLSSTVSGVSELEIEWLWFAPGQERLVLEITSRGRPSARLLTPGENSAQWRMGESIALPDLQAVPGLESIVRRPFRHFLFVGVALLVYAGVVVVRKKTSTPAWTGWLVVAGLLAAFVALQFQTDEVVVPADAEREELVYALLRNTYHAFDFRDEAAIYDTLERSVSGALLERVYLEMRSSLELENEGGPRVRVYEIALRECQDLPNGGLGKGGFRTLAEWVTIGEVTHWGHTHERTNKYEAEMTISDSGGGWKISGLDLRNEERVQKVSRRTVKPES